MITVRIYCPLDHSDFESTNSIVKEAFLKHDLEHKIHNITSEEIIYQSRIKMVPHIVINSQVVYCGSCPKLEEMDIILKRMGFIK